MVSRLNATAPIVGSNTEQKEAEPDAKNTLLASSRSETAEYILHLLTELEALAIGAKLVPLAYQLRTAKAAAEEAQSAGD